MPIDLSKVCFLDGSARELRLKEPRVNLFSRQDNEPRRVGIQPVSGPEFFGIVSHLKDPLERVEIKTTRGMDGQRSALVDHDDRVIFMQQYDVGIDFWFGVVPNRLQKTLPISNDIVRVYRTCIELAFRCSRQQDLP